MVYGGGAAFGIAYNAGVAAGLADAGVPVATAPAIGTSAGSWTALAVALGMSCLGRRIRFLVSGSAALSKDVAT